MKKSNDKAARAFILLSLQFWVSVVVTGFFVTMMYLQWERETAKRVGVQQLDISPDLLAVTWVDYDQFMWVERAGKQVGAYALLIRRTPDHKNYEMTTQLRMEMPVFNQELTAKLDVYVTMNGLFDMQTFQAVLNAAGEQVSVDAFTEGLRMYYQASGPAGLIQGGAAASYFDLENPIILKDAILPVVAVARKMEVGDRWTATASDPISGSYNVPVQVEVLGEEEIINQGLPIMTKKVKETAQDIETLSWYDDQGFVVRTQIGKDIVLERARRQDVELAFPELKATLVFPDIDKAQLKQNASSAEGQGPNPSLMPGLLKGW